MCKKITIKEKLDEIKKQVTKDAIVFVIDKDWDGELEEHWFYISDYPSDEVYNSDLDNKIVTYYNKAYKENIRHHYIYFDKSEEE